MCISLWSSELSFLESSRVSAISVVKVLGVFGGCLAGAMDSRASGFMWKVWNRLCSGEGWRLTRCRAQVRTGLCSIISSISHSTYSSIIMRNDPLRAYLNSFLLYTPTLSWPCKLKHRTVVAQWDTLMALKLTAWIAQAQCARVPQSDASHGGRQHQLPALGSA